MPGFWELILLVVICLLLFGARRLPEIGAGLGKSLSNFQKSLRSGKDAETSDDRESFRDEN